MSVTWPSWAAEGDEESDRGVVCRSTTSTGLRIRNILRERKAHPLGDAEEVVFRNRA